MVLTTRQPRTLHGLSTDSRFVKMNSQNRTPLVIEEVFSTPDLCYQIMNHLSLTSTAALACVTKYTHLLKLIHPQSPIWHRMALSHIVHVENRVITIEFVPIEHDRILHWKCVVHQRIFGGEEDHVCMEATIGSFTQVSKFMWNRESNVCIRALDRLEALAAAPSVRHSTLLNKLDQVAWGWPAWEPTVPGSSDNKHKLAMRSLDKIKHAEHPRTKYSDDSLKLNLTLYNMYEQRFPALQRTAVRRRAITAKLKPPRLHLTAEDHALFVQPVGFEFCIESATAVHRRRLSVLKDDLQKIKLPLTVVRVLASFGMQDVLKLPCPTSDEIQAELDKLEEHLNRLNDSGLYSDMRSFEHLPNERVSPNIFT